MGQCKKGTEGCAGDILDIQRSGDPCDGKVICDRHYRIAVNKYNLKRKIGKARVGFVYFVYTPYDTIKIGFSTDPVGRWMELTKSFGGPLTPLAIVEGSERDEQDLHKKFDAYRIYEVFGEQFEPSKEITDYARALPVHETFNDRCTRYMSTRLYGQTTMRKYRGQASYRRFASPGT